MISLHPFDPYVPKGAKKLIIGTIPPPRFCRIPKQLICGDVNFYYGSRDNYFWPILSEVFEMDFKYSDNNEAVQQRKSFLNRLQVGITDIIARCTHDENSASDYKLRDIEFKDIGILLQNHPSISTLIYTSLFVKKLINRHLGLYHTLSKVDNRKLSIKIGNKTYQVVILYSPSPSALRNMGNGGRSKRLEQYRKVFLDS